MYRPLTRVLFVVLIVAHAFVTAACGTFNISAPVTTPQTAPDPQQQPASSTDAASSSEAAQVLPQPQAARAQPTAAPVSLVWKDPVTAYTWRVVALSVPLKEAVCPKGSMLPETTIPTKFADFILSHAGPLADGGLYWTSLQGQIGEFVRSIESDGQTVFDVKESTFHVTICVER